MILALASAAIFDRKSAAGSPMVSIYAAVQGRHRHGLALVVVAEFGLPLLGTRRRVDGHGMRVDGVVKNRIVGPGRTAIDALAAGRPLGRSIGARFRALSGKVGTGFSSENATKQEI
jgi:hypothetical protein